ncbi:MAG: biotin transporter BioY [Gammaproteobacteria bacterium]|nr:biotin transporter BioY [Gammaproteobacteria bacterium]
MTSIAQNHPTLIQAAWKTDSSLLRSLLLAVAGSLALWVSAKVQIPFFPVPLTMQTLVVLMIGMSFGWKLGGATLALYLAEGAVGLPVFSGTPEKGIGLAYMMGPTGGYLFGMFVAAIAVGWLATKGFGKKVWTTFLAMLVGNGLIYLFGLLWLGTVVGWDKPVLAWGLTPFLLGDLVKIVLAMIALPSLWKLLNRHNDDQDTAQ